MFFQFKRKNILNYVYLKKTGLTLGFRSCFNSDCQVAFKMILLWSLPPARNPFSQLERGCDWIKDNIFGLVTHKILSVSLNKCLILLPPGWTRL